MEPFHNSYIWLMKYLSLLALLLFNNTLNAQEYSFQLYIKSPCDSIAKPAKTIYYLLDTKTTTEYIMGVDSEHNFTYEPILVSSPGTYRLSCMQLPEIKEMEVHIEKPGLTKHIIYLPKITLHSAGLEGFREYRDCDSLCNGYHEDRYSNGIMRIKGSFKQGIPNKLKTYYPNEKLESKLNSRFKKNYITHYDTLGNITSKFWSQRLPHTGYKDWGETIYFPDQKIQIRKSIINHIFHLKIYNPDGTLKIKSGKNERIEYQENGKIKTVYKWEKGIKHDHYGYEQHIFIIQKNNYDKKGNLINTEKSSEDVANYPQPRIAFSELIVI